MQITISQTELSEAILNYLKDKNIQVKSDTLIWDVDWDQQYDSEPTNIQVTFQLP